MNKIYKQILVLALGFVPYLVNAQMDKSFDKIKIIGDAHVVLVQGTLANISFEDKPSKDVSRNYSISDDGWLLITGNPSDEIMVTAVNITAIEISGTGKLESEGVINTKDIMLSIGGVGKLEMQLIASSVKAEISGAGKIELDGSADELEINISGSGKIDGESFNVKKCLTNISGSGKCLVNVTDELTSNISGSGKVYYTEPAPIKINTNLSTTGIGKVGAIDQADNDTTRITFGKRKILIIGEDGKDVRFSFKDGLSSGNKVKSHWAGFELGINMLMNKDQKNEAPQGFSYLDQKVEKSIAINFNLINYDIKLYKRNVMLVSGLGFTINNYRFNSNNYILPNQNVVMSNPDTISLKKNKLVASYITVPLLLEFNTSRNPDRTVHLAFGVIGGLRTGAHLKLVKVEDGNESKNKVFDDFNLNTIRYDATVRFGYRGTTLFASYGLAELFKNNKGPELHPLTLGVKLVGW